MESQCPVSRAVKSAWNKAGIVNDITCTLIHKTAVLTTHQKMSQLKTRLADLMCHRGEKLPSGPAEGYST